MWVVWSKQQAMCQDWGLEEGIRARFFWPQGWPTCPFSTLTSYMGTEHGVSAGVLGGDPVWAPFPVPAPRKEQATRPPPVFLRKLEPLSEHRQARGLEDLHQALMITCNTGNIIRSASRGQSSSPWPAALRGKNRAHVFISPHFQASSTWRRLGAAATPVGGGETTWTHLSLLCHSAFLLLVYAVHLPTCLLSPGIESHSPPPPSA